MLLHVYPLRTFTARLKHHKRERAIRVCPCESPLTANASGEIFTGMRQAPDHKNESMLCSTSLIAWKSASYNIKITLNYIAEIWNKAYSEDCAQDAGWVPVVRANWTENIYCAGFASKLQNAPAGCHTTTGRSHMGSSTPLPSRISTHSVWWHWQGHSILTDRLRFQRDRKQLLWFVVLFYILKQIYFRFSTERNF